jgi:UDP-3-O-[3-hydroxymyristoyl] glucosamine N-acyltransferase
MGAAQAKQMTLGELARQLGGALTGDPERPIRGANGIAEAGADEVTFLANARYEKFMPRTRAAAVIVADTYAGPGESLIRCQDPYFAFRQAMVLLYGFRAHPFKGLDASARIDPSARLGQDVAVAQFASVGPDVQVGDRTVIYPGVFVGAGCRIGADCVLYPNAVLYEGTVLGQRVTIHACTVIGQDGFGYATHAGEHQKIPQAGWVEIGDDVEIGANCAIDRATVGATVVAAGTKFSNLVAIGHGAKVGRHCLFVAQSGVAGSTTIGNYCVFGGQSGVVGHISIGDEVSVAAQAGVINDIQSKQEVMGAPAIPRVQARRVYSTLNQLPELRRQVRQLAAEIAALKAQAKGGEKSK